MREREFERWFGTFNNKYDRPYTAGNIDFYVTAARNVERASGVDLDKEFRKDKITALYDDYKYSKQDKLAKRPPPTNIRLHREIYDALADIRSALNHYRRFCEQNPPV